MIAARLRRESVFAAWGNGLGKRNMSAQKTSDSTKPLSHYVANSLDGFFRTLNGHAPKDLYGMILDQVEAPLLRATLKYCDGNQSRAASVLGLNRATLRKKLRHHKIKEQPSARA